MMSPADASARTTLHDLHERMAERVRAAGSADAPAARLGLLIGERRWLVDLSEAGEIVPVPQIVPVPLTRDWFRGLVNLRGALHTVVDLARFAGGAPTPVDKDTRLLALGARLQFNATLLVSRVLGLRQPGGMRPREAQPDAEPGAGIGVAPDAGLVAEPGTEPDAEPPTEPGARARLQAPWLGATWVDDGGLEWRELSLARLVQDERFLHAGR